jgi:hypothetical protein
MEPSEIITKNRPYIEKDPGDPRFARVGEAFLEMGDLKNALAVLTRGVKANPRYPTGQLILAHGLRQAGYLPQAKERLKVVLRLDSSNIAALWQLASIAFEEGEDDEGIRNLKKIMLINPYLPEARNELKNRTGIEFGPPQPPKSKIEPQLPVPTAQEGPIVIKKDKEEFEDDLEEIQEVAVAATEQASAVIREEPAEPEPEIHTEESKPAESEEFEELFEMDVSEMEVVEEAPKTEHAPIAEGSSSLNEFEKQPTNAPSVETAPQKIEEPTASAEKVVAEARSETPKEETPPKIDEEKPIWAVESKDAEEEFLKGAEIIISENAVLFEETKEEEPLHKDEEDLVDFGSLSKKREPKTENIPSPESSEEASEVVFDETFTPDFSEKPSVAESRQEAEIIDENLRDTQQEEVIEVSSPEELARLIGGAENLVETAETEEQEAVSEEPIEEDFSAKPDDPDTEFPDFFGEEPVEIENTEDTFVDDTETLFSDEKQPQKIEEPLPENIAENPSEVETVQPEPQNDELDLSEFEELVLDDAGEPSEIGISEFADLGVEEKTDTPESPEIEEIEIEERTLSAKQPDDEEKINGLITHNGFEASSDVEKEQIAGIIKSGEFKRPEVLDDSIEGLLAREEFVPEIVETDFEKIEGLDVNREFVPDSRDRPEPEEQEDEPEPELYTVTMAEIYAAQGQIENAVWIYDKILERTDIEEDRARIEQRVAHLKKSLEGGA